MDNVSDMTTLTALQLPIEWTQFGWPATPRIGDVVLTTGDPKWAWTPIAPAFTVHAMEVPDATEVPGFAIDHVVLLVPDIDRAISRFDGVGLEPRLKMRVQGRPAAFFRGGPVIEVIESPVRQASIYGIAVGAEESLESLALAWKAKGLSVGDVKGAIQPGRRIMTVHDLDAGFAVMSPERPLG
jgi:catechol 2,3-dioxygenase-like lactoylglutathione lyase family enzyme